MTIVLVIYSHHTLPYVMNSTKNIYNRRSQTTSAHSNAICDFILADSFVAIATEETSMDLVRFIKVTKINSARNGKDVDDYGHIIPTSLGYMIGHFLEKSSQSTKTSETYTLS